MWEKIIYRYETEEEMKEKLFPLLSGFKTLVLVGDKETTEFILVGSEVGQEVSEKNDTQADKIVKALNA